MLYIVFVIIYLTYNILHIHYCNISHERLKPIVGDQPREWYDLSL